MSLSGPFICDFPPIFVELGKSLGVYVIEQHVEPVILLNSKLEETNLSLAQEVYNTLYRFHDSLEEVYKLFPLKVYYEDLMPAETTLLSLPEPGEIIFVGRAFRIWHFHLLTSDEPPRVIGKAG
jgi:hypothetical protein